MKMKELLTTKEVARLLKLSPKTIQLMRHEGRGPRFIRIGSSVRYRQEDIEAWLASIAEEGSDGR
jgi:excisionase family DNA binding protein